MFLRNRSNRTNSEQKDEALKPLVVRLGANECMNKVNAILLQYQFEVVTPRLDYHETYAKLGYFEFTVSFIEDFGKTNISVLCFSEKKPFGIKKNLKSLMLFLREKLEGYLI